MDPLSQLRLQEIIRKEPHELTENDKGFLHARRSYLTAEQISKYHEVLGVDVPVKQEPVKDDFTPVEPVEAKEDKPLSFEGDTHNADPDWKG